MMRPGQDGLPLELKLRRLTDNSLKQVLRGFAAAIEDGNRNDETTDEGMAEILDRMGKALKELQRRQHGKTGTAKDDRGRAAGAA